jgi:hypothetical protein
MFGFIKKLFGFDKETLEAAGVKIEQAAATESKAFPTAVNDQITDSVTTKPAVKLPIDNPAEKPKKKRQFAKKTTAAITAPATAKAPKPRGRKPKTKNS